MPDIKKGAPSQSEGGEGATDFRWIEGRGLFFFCKYQGKWYSRGMSDNPRSVSQEVAGTNIPMGSQTYTQLVASKLVVNSDFTFAGSANNLTLPNASINYDMLASDADSWLLLSDDPATYHIGLQGGGLLQVIGTDNEVDVTMDQYETNKTTLQIGLPSDVNIAGDLTVTGSATVDGGATTINSSDLTIADHQIIIGAVESPTDSTADEGGFILKSVTGDKSILWEDDDDRWHFNQGIEVDTGDLIVDNNLGIGTTTPDNVLEVYHGSNPQLRLTRTDGTDYVELEAGADGDFYINRLQTSAGNQRMILSHTDATNGTNIQTDGFASGVTGWQIDHNGAADLRYLGVDEMHAKAFIADLEQALAGGQIIAKSVAILAEDYDLPELNTSSDFYVKDLPSAAGMNVFVDNDWVRFRIFTRPGSGDPGLTIGDAWGKVTYVSSTAGIQRWTFARPAGTPGGAAAGGTTITADSIILDYGTYGNGYYEVNAIDGPAAENSPYAQIVTWDDGVTGATGPGTTDALNVNSRFGNLKGLTSTDEYGLMAGTGVASTDKFLLLSDQSAELHNLPLVCYENAAVRAKIDPTIPCFGVGDTAESTELPEASEKGFWVGQDIASAGDYDCFIGDKAGDHIEFKGSTGKMTVTGTMNILSGSTIPGGFNDASSAYNNGANTDDVSLWDLNDDEIDDITTVTDSDCPAGTEAFNIVREDGVTHNCFSQKMQCDPNRTYQVSVWGKETAGSNPLYLLVGFQTSGGSNIEGDGSGLTGWLSLGTYFYWGRANTRFSSVAYENYSITFGPAGIAEIPPDARTMVVGGLYHHASGQNGAGVVRIHQYRVLTSEIADGVTIHGGGIEFDSGGEIHSYGKLHALDTTAGFFMGYDGIAGYDLAIGDGSNHLIWDASASELKIAGEITVSNSGDFANTQWQEETTIDSGSVTLSAGGHIKGGQTAYNTGTGFFLGYESANYVFSIGDGANNGMAWNGGQLAIGSSVTIGGALTSEIIEDAQLAQLAAENAQEAAEAAEAEAEAAETAALQAESDAQSAQSSAETAETNAETAETNAETAESNAETAESNAGTSASNASTSASNASTSEGNASGSATSAETSASNSSTYAGNSSTSASNASTSESNASTSASNASTAETNAETAETNAETAETNAETAETNAETAETNAETAESNAETAETNAQTAEGNESTYASNAASSASTANGYWTNWVTPDTTTINGNQITTGSIVTGALETPYINALDGEFAGTLLCNGPVGNDDVVPIRLLNNFNVYNTIEMKGANPRLIMGNSDSEADGSGFYSYVGTSYIEMWATRADPTQNGFNAHSSTLRFRSDEDSSTDASKVSLGMGMGDWSTFSNMPNLSLKGDGTDVRKYPESAITVFFNNEVWCRPTWTSGWTYFTINSKAEWLYPSSHHGYTAVPWILDAQFCVGSNPDGDSDQQILRCDNVLQWNEIYGWYGIEQIWNRQGISITSLNPRIALTHHSQVTDYDGTLSAGWQGWNTGYIRICTMGHGSLNGLTY